MSKQYALLGESLKHTMSPPIHKRLFELKGREFNYEIIELKADELESNKDKLLSLTGMNITIPHKIGIIPYCDRLDESAKRYNSVNCIDNKGGVHTGYNTDCDGFLKTISAMGLELSGEVLLIGCGGVGRMMAIEASLKGGRLTIAVLESDMPLAQKVKEEILSVKADADISIILTSELESIERADLLMNATPVGMFPKVDACPVPDSVIEKSSYVFDVIYNPRETQLIQKAKALGKKVSGGMAMLVYQAVSAHEIWDGDRYDDADIAELISDMEKMV